MGKPDTKAVEKSRFLKEYTEDLVELWDDYVDWKGRAEAENGFFEKLLAKHGAKRVLDAATGTGFHAIELSKSGLRVDASDGSPNMVDKARENAKAHGQPDMDIRAVDWAKLPETFEPGAYDAVLCLGNSLTHLHNVEDQHKAIAGMHAMLRKGGVLVIDQRNYDKLIDEGFSSSHKYYYRGDNVDGIPEEVNENIVRFKCVTDDGEEYPLTLKPIRQAHLTKILREQGFDVVDRYGDFKQPFEKYDPDFVIQVGRKQ